jgi:hypothetical protein
VCLRRIWLSRERSLAPTVRTGPAGRSRILGLTLSYRGCMRSGRRERCARSEACPSDRQAAASQVRWGGVVLLSTIVVACSGSPPDTPRHRRWNDKHRRLVGAPAGAGGATGTGAPRSGARAAQAVRQAPRRFGGASGSGGTTTRGASGSVARPASGHRRFGGAAAVAARQARAPPVGWREWQWRCRWFERQRRDGQGRYGRRRRKWS